MFSVCWTAAGGNSTGQRFMAEVMLFYVRHTKTEAKIKKRGKLRSCELEQNICYFLRISRTPFYSDFSLEWSKSFDSSKSCTAFSQLHRI